MSINNNFFFNFHRRIRIPIPSREKPSPILKSSVELKPLRLKHSRNKSSTVNLKSSLWTRYQNLVNHHIRNKVRMESPRRKVTQERMSICMILKARSKNRSNLTRVTTIKAPEKMQKCQLNNQKMIPKIRRRKKTTTSRNHNQLSWKTKRFVRMISNLQVQRKMVNQSNLLKINKRKEAGIKLQN